MKQTVAAALILLSLLFVVPLAAFGWETPSASPIPTGALPLDRTVVTPAPSADGARMVDVKLSDGTVTTLSMADYLWRVVAAEMPASFEPDALAAQSVAARTYALYKSSRRPASHPDADLCTDITCCQAFLTPEDAKANWGVNADAYAAKITAAVAETDGVVATYNESPIQAVFFSSAAGRTVDAVEVWGSSVPYLVGVDSPEGAEVPNYHSSLSLTPEEFKTKFTAQYPAADLSGAPSGWFQNRVSNSAGGVETVDVGGVAVTGSALRTLLGLRSSSFTVAATDQAIAFAVTGYGHGVGLSQYGANAMAKEGKGWREILQWYYTGVTLETWNG